MIVRWFEERETAAKKGRPVWNEMLKLLRQGKAHGVLIHKIDRSARNLKDWADLGDCIDDGIEVHFANEGLDLNSRGGRLSADIQAVVAADYIRNLREEAKKGIYGRLKQGFYPSRAPIGYLDNGAAKPKTIDPVILRLHREPQIFSDRFWRNFYRAMLTHAVRSASTKLLAALLGILLLTGGRAGAQCHSTIVIAADLTKSVERVSKIDSASHQALTCKAGYRLSFCHEDPAEAVDQRAVGTD